MAATESTVNTPGFRHSRIDTNPTLKVKQHRLRDELLDPTHKPKGEVSYPLDAEGMALTAGFGVGRVVMLDLPKIPGIAERQRVYAAVHPDTNFAQRRLRLAIAYSPTGWLPDNLNPRKRDNGLNPGEVDLLLFNLTRSPRGEHGANAPVSVLETVHFKNALVSLNRGSRARQRILNQRPDQQAHFGDILQQEGNEGQVSFMAATTPEETGAEILEDPADLLDVMYFEYPNEEVDVVIDVEMIDPASLLNGFIVPMEAGHTEELSIKDETEEENGKGGQRKKAN